MLGMGRGTSGSYSIPDFFPPLLFFLRQTEILDSATAEVNEAGDGGEGESAPDAVQHVEGESDEKLLTAFDSATDAQKEEAGIAEQEKEKEEDEEEAKRTGVDANKQMPEPVQQQDDVQMEVIFGGLPEFREVNLHIINRL